VTVAELMKELSALDPGMPVLAYYKPTGGYANAEITMTNAGSARPYVVIAVPDDPL